MSKNRLKKLKDKLKSREVWIYYEPPYTPDDFKDFNRFDYGKIHFRQCFGVTGMKEWSVCPKNMCIGCEIHDCEHNTKAGEA